MKDDVAIRNTFRIARILNKHNVKCVIKIVRDDPGVIMRDIGMALRMDRHECSKLMSPLFKYGIIRAERKGHKKRCFLHNADKYITLCHSIANIAQQQTAEKKSHPPE